MTNAKTKGPQPPKKAVRNSKGHFQKGASGNPGGRTKGFKRVVELAREQTEASIAALAEIRDDRSQHGSARVCAANSLLDRGWGKAPAELKLSGALTVGAHELSDEELAEIAAGGGDS